MFNTLRHEDRRRSQRAGMGDTNVDEEHDEYSPPFPESPVPFSPTSNVRYTRISTQPLTAVNQKPKSKPQAG